MIEEVNNSNANKKLIPVRNSDLYPAGNASGKPLHINASRINSETGAAKKKTSEGR